MKRITFLTIAMGILLLSACLEKSGRAESLNGVWESVRSGWVPEFADRTLYTT